MTKKIKYSYEAPCSAPGACAGVGGGGVQSPPPLDLKKLFREVLVLGGGG